MSNTGKSAGEIFEDEVKRIARELWPQAAYSGSVNFEGRETDGVFITEECVNIIEATILRTKDKAQQDGEKLKQLFIHYSRKSSEKAVRCFFITKFEPTSDQREALKNILPSINALQYSQFQQKLINAPQYLSARANYPFGSARDPEQGDINPKSGYINLDILEPKARDAWGLERIKNTLLVGGRICLLGDFGAGKSMTLKEIYKLLARDFNKGMTEKFPIYINLRDHQGQYDPAEILLRHSTNIGFEQPDHLMRAWRAGYSVIVLDGFDEIGAIGWTGQWKKLRDLRHRAMTAVRKFAASTPTHTGIIIAGRAHFFDNDQERKGALGLNGDSVDLTLSDFSEEQIEKYLSAFNLKSKIPSWLPKRPLLLGYLASRGFISEILQNRENHESANDAASGWDHLVQKITEREADIEAGIDGLTLRRILERIATKARASADGIGPIYQNDLDAAFEEICGYQPDDLAMVILQRLPGLGAKLGVQEARYFIHEDLTDACRVGDIIAFVQNPYEFPLKVFENMECQVGDIALDIIINKHQEGKITQGLQNAAIDTLKGKEKCIVALADLALCNIRQQWPLNSATYIKNASISSIDLGEISQDLTQYIFQDCFIKRLELPPAGGELIPRFQSTYIDLLVGRISLRDLPAGAFDEKCIIETYESSTSTTKEIMDLDLPTGQKVMLAILKKLYIQKGAGRRDGALYRGLDSESKRVVPDVMQALKADALVYEARHAGNTVWYPIRSKTRRVYDIIKAPAASKDPVFVASAMFSS